MLGCCHLMGNNSCSLPSERGKPLSKGYNDSCTNHWQNDATHVLPPLMQPPFLPINRHQKSRTKRENKRERREQERNIWGEKEGVAAKGSSPAALCNSVWE
jgi:hypothetical protein